MWSEFRNARVAEICRERVVNKKFFVITDSLIAVRLTLVSLASHSRHHGVAPRSLVLQRGHQGESSGRSVIVIVNPADSAALSAAATRRVHPAVQRMTHLSELLDVRQGACPGHQSTTLQFTLVSNAYISSRHNLTSPKPPPRFISSTHTRRATRCSCGERPCCDLHSATVKPRTVSSTSPSTMLISTVLYELWKKCPHKCLRRRKAGFSDTDLWPPRTCDSSLCEWLNVRYKPCNNNNNCPVRAPAL